MHKIQRTNGNLNMRKTHVMHYLIYERDHLLKSTFIPIVDFSEPIRERVLHRIRITDTRALLDRVV